MLLTYESNVPGAPLLLFRPTVADAADYEHFRPHPDRTTAHGFTFPIPPNPNGLAALPEVVHREITGETLRFPLLLVR